MDDSYIAYQCKSLTEWKNIMKYELEKSTRFEIHSWSDEMSAVETAIKYGKRIDSDWQYGVVISGVVTEGFIGMILGESNCELINGYHGFTKFFSIFLDTGFSSEHYGTELYKF